MRYYSLNVFDPAEEMLSGGLACNGPSLRLSPCVDGGDNDRRWHLNRSHCQPPLLHPAQDPVQK